MEPITKAKIIKKRWGGETWLANNEVEDYCGKILHLNSGQSTSMHYHLDKHETFYVLEGQLTLELLDTRGGEKSQVILDVGEGYEIKRGQPHQLSATVFTRIIEISTFHRNEDSHRLWI